MEGKPATQPLKFEDISHIIVRTYLPYCLYIKNCNLVVVIEGKPAYVTLEFISSSEIRGVTEFIKVPQISRLKYDRWGRQSQTLISISFPRHSWPEGFIPKPSFEEKFFIYSIKYINKLVDCYKYATKEFLCDELTELDFIYFDFIYYNTNEKEYEFATNVFPFGNILAEGEENTFCSQEVFEKIENSLIQNAELSVSDNLAFNANSFMLKGQYNLAVFLAAQSFESVIKNIIRQGYIQDGTKTKEEITELLEKCSFGNLVKGHLRIVTGFDFSNTSEYLEWDKKVRPLRNSIAHGENPKVTKDNANEMIKILNEARKKVKENISI